MNILEICFSKAWGGLEIYVGTFAKELTNRGNNVIGISLPNSKLINTFKKDAIPNYSIKPIFKYLDFFTVYKIKYLIKNKIDIIHVHQSKDLSTAILLKKFLKTSKIVYSQQMDSRYNKKDIFHRWIYSNIDYVITMTDDMKNNHINSTPVNPNKIKTIYNGIDLSRFTNKTLINKLDILDKLKIPEDKVIIGSIGRLDSLKNQELLVDAAKILFDDGYNNFHVLLVGDETNSITGKGYRNNLLMKIKNYNLTEYFSLLDFSDQVEKFFYIMDIFVLPTNKESFGYVLIEAMAMAKPVIASDQGGPKEIISDSINGFLFESKNSKNLVEKIKILLDNKDLRIKMGVQSHKIANEKFDINSTIENYIKLFDSLIDNEKHCRFS